MFSQDQRSYSGGSDGYHPDVYVTHTEEYGDPEEETSVLIDEDGNEKTVKVHILVYLLLSFLNVHSVVFA